MGTLRMTHEKAKTRDRLLGAWSSALVVIVLVSVLLEGVSWVLVRSRGLNLDPDEISQHLYSPYRVHELNPKFQYRLADRSRVLLHSADGFREDLKVFTEKPDGVFRIIALGGSTLYGIEAGEPYPYAPALMNDETIDYFLEQIINSEIAGLGGVRRVEVINAGLIGYQTFQHLVYVNETLWEYSPDLLIFLDGHNDFYDARDDFNHWKDYQYYSATNMLNRPSLFFSSYIMSKVWARHSHFGYLVFRVLHAKWQAYLRNAALEKARAALLPPDQVETKYENYAEKTFLRAYRQIRTLGAELGSDIVVFLQPELDQENRRLLSPADRELQEITLEQEEPLTAERKKRIRARLPALFDKHGIEFHDLVTLADETTRDRRLYTDYCHLSPAGSLLAAEKIADALRPRLASLLATGPAAEPEASPGSPSRPRGIP